jgi:thioredoxin-related protein
MKNTVALLVIAVISAGLLNTVNATPGKMTGGQAFHIPDWFKVSFLEIDEDAREASEAGKHLLLFMHLENCPYCKRMLEENFTEGANKDFIQKHFDVIDINIRGSRSVAWDAESMYSELTLARELSVYATPTMLFLNGKGHIVYRTNGYRTPEAVRNVMNYVNDRQYGKIPFAQYVEQKAKERYQLKNHPAFETMKDFSSYDGPLAVIFEDPSCSDCAEFHQYTLQHPDVLKEMKGLKVVRLDAWSDDSIIDTDGNKTTPKQWARALKMDYRPGTVLFDDSTEVTRADGQLYHFHYKEMLRYVAKGLYFQYPTYLLYLSARQRQLLKDGVNIDLGR